MLLKKFDEAKGELALIGWHAFFDAQSLGIPFEGMWKMEDNTTWDDFVKKLVITKTEVHSRNVVHDGVTLTASIVCNVVHNHKIITYDVLLGTKSVEQTGKYEEALAAYVAL